MFSSEAELHVAVLEYLAWAFPGVFYHHSPNETWSGDEKQMARIGAIRKRMGCKTGFYDLILCWAAKDQSAQTGFIELKMPGKYLSNTQKHLHAVLAAIHARQATCRSVEEVRDALIGWGVPCRENVRTDMGTKLKGFEAQRPL